MSRPSPHPKTRVYRAREAVPAELRAIVGKRELIETLGTKDPAEAKRRHPEVLERFEAVLAAARDRLSVRCLNAGCRRAVVLPIGDLMLCHRLPKDMTLHEVWRRLRCIECGAREPEIDMPDARRR